MIDLIRQIMGWSGAHPHAAGAIVALVAFLESLAFIGLLIPGAVVICGAGALIAGGAIGFWPMLAWAMMGAILGDGISYWLGRRYKSRIHEWWPFARFPEGLARGEVFFRRHGGKSIALGRFVGPVRALIPVVAGMLGMSPARFYLANVLSAFAWASAYLLLGMAFGASLVLAREVAGRLALFLSVLLILAWVILWIIRAGYRQVQPRTVRWATRLMAWGRAHPRLGWPIGALVDPARPASRALLVWLGLLMASAWLFFGVFEDVLTDDPLVLAGQSLYQLLQQLRSPLGDRVMVVLSELGDAAVLVPVVLGVLAWLLWRRLWRDGLYWLAAGGFGTLAVVVIRVTLRIPRPVEGLYSGVDVYSFPSGHATLSTVVYGFLATLIAPALPLRARWVPYSLAALLISGIAFSRLYLGAHWLADVAAGLSLGVAWIAVLAIARHRRRGGPFAIRGLGAVACAVFLAAAALHVHGRLQTDLARYAVRDHVREMRAQDWWQSLWEDLPAYRLDMEGEREQPLTLQWAGELPALRRTLLAMGWHEPLAVTPRTALRWLLPNPSLDQLPVLPQLHRGRHESLLMVRAEISMPDRQLVLRLWPTDVRLRPGDVPLWIGSVTWQRIQRLAFVSIPRSADDDDEALSVMRVAPADTAWKEVWRPKKPDGSLGGDVLLFRSRDE